jgi:tRNA threonylcarbamoyl adenosine modification protein (Sua5/YciO/YrdC/YwlC family)
MLLPINPDHPEPRKIKRAVELIQRGSVIGYPTDTVYGLGCDLLNKQAIDALYQIKGMQRDKSLAFLCPDLSDIAKYAIVENQAYRVLRHFLPGPYCFILPATREVPKMLQTRQKTVGIRIPSHPVTLALMRELGRPLITTTASSPGEDPMVDPWEISERFPGLELVLDGGGGGTVPTTVVDLSEGYVKIIREGAGPIDELIALEK